MAVGRLDSVAHLLLLLLLLTTSTSVEVEARPTLEDVPPDDLEGPGMDSPLMRDSDQMEAWQLPMEHRHQWSIEKALPDIKNIADSTYEQLGVDLFFSMWFVFLNDDVKTSDQPFTILAPINSSKTKPERLLQDEALAEEIITNHFLLGEEIIPERLVQPEVRFTSGGQRLDFRVDKEGELWVNNVQIIGWTKVDNGIVLALEDYLYTEHIEETDLALLPRVVDESTMTTVTPTSTTTSSTTTTTWTKIPDNWVKIEKCETLNNSETMFKTIQVCVEEFVDPNSDEGLEWSKRKGLRKDSNPEPLAKANEDALPEFLQDIVDVLSVLRFGSNHFLEYIQQNREIRQAFKQGEKYTALIPYDEAFQAWHPIDWGFNPFEVESFVRETLLNHFVVGDVNTDDLDEVTLETLGGKNITFTKSGDKISVNGVNLVEGGTEVPNGEILFVDKLLFVTDEDVKKLNDEFGYLESGPLLPYPWYESQFLSHIFHDLSEKEKYSYLTEYMNLTEELGQFAEGESGFTFLVPGDDAFWKVLVKDVNAPDPFVLDHDFRLQTLKGLIIEGRLFVKDLQDGSTLRTMANKTLTIHRNENQLLADDGRQNISLSMEDHFVYNLGNLYFTDKIPFVQASDVLNVLEKHSDTIVDDDDVADDDESVDEFGDFADTDDTEEETKKPELIARATRKSAEAEDYEMSADTLISFPGGAWKDYEVEEKVIFINNQKISILKQKLPQTRND